MRAQDTKRLLLTSQGARVWRYQEHDDMLGLSAIHTLREHVLRYVSSCFGKHREDASSCRLQHNGYFVPLCIPVLHWAGTPCYEIVQNR